MNTLDRIIHAASNLEREATLARVGLAYTYEDEATGELVLPAGTSAHVEATKSLLAQLIDLAI
jgi:hypothetical protein